MLTLAPELNEENLQCQLAGVLAARGILLRLSNMLRDRLSSGPAQTTGDHTEPRDKENHNAS